MNVKFLVPLAAALLLAACNSSGFSPGTSGQSPAQGTEFTAKSAGTPACPQVTGVPTCLVLIQSKSGISPTVAGWAPSDFQTRYNLPSSTKGSGQTVAIVDANDNPNVATDLATYRTEFGLGTANFNKYNQDGQESNYPQGSKNWGVEIDLDVEMVSAVCPKCTIDLIEANGADTSDFQTAELEAVKLGAHIVSNSWICYESNSCVDPSDFDTPGVAYLAASGDRGYNENGNPESLASVIAVGGTILQKSGSTYSEIVWPSAGGGCSSNGGSSGVAKPAWQKDPDCTYRTDADVAAVASGVAEYDSYGYSGWFTVGGTSVASPMTAGVVALAGNATTLKGGERFWKLKKKAKNHDFHYIMGGSDGSCGGEYLCQAGTKQFGNYAGPIGWGTPNGVKGY